MALARRLLQLALLLLWLQLLLAGQLTWLVTLALPALLLLGLRQRGIERAPLTWITLAIVATWAVTTPLADQSSWLESFASLVWLMASLQLLQAMPERHPHHAVLVVLLGIGLAGVLNQSLAASLLQGTAALLSIAALLALEAGMQPLAGLLRRSITLVAMLLPLVLLAFLLLPRLPALWNLPDGSSGQIGLGDQLQPGSLASLVQTPGIAARVSFASAAPPPPEQSYWRVLVHSHFDGSSWSQGSQPLLMVPPSGPSGHITQRWLVEPTQLPWRPWSGAGLPTNDDLELSRSGGLWAGFPLRERTSYAIASNPAAGRWRQLPPSPGDLALPLGSNPRLEALGAQWQLQASAPEERVALAKRWFMNQPFRYTLEPGRLPNRAPLDAFLFDRQRGFCEHYAASFSALMRAAGIPARVVVGYQGGRWRQPLGTSPYLLLEHSDAHAWSELWLPGQGWVEVDPTGWVVPDRLRHSLSDSLSASERQRLGGMPPAWLQAITNQWEGLDTRWQIWVMQFNSSSQAQLLAPWLGSQRRWQGLLAIGGIAASLAGAVALAQLQQRQRRPKRSDAARMELDLCLQALDHLQLRPAPAETLQQFCRRAGQTEPDLGPPLEQLANAYNRFRFATDQGQPSSRLRRDLLPIKRMLRRVAHRRKA